MKIINAIVISFTLTFPLVCNAFSIPPINPIEPYTGNGVLIEDGYQDPIKAYLRFKLPIKHESMSWTKDPSSGKEYDWGQWLSPENIGIGINLHEKTTSDGSFSKPIFAPSDAFDWNQNFRFENNKITTESGKCLTRTNRYKSSGTNYKGASCETDNYGKQYYLTHFDHRVKDINISTCSNIPEQYWQAKIDSYTNNVIFYNNSECLAQSAYNYQSPVYYNSSATESGCSPNGKYQQTRNNVYIVNFANCSLPEANYQVPLNDRTLIYK